MSSAFASSTPAMSDQTTLPEDCFSIVAGFVRGM